jgi:hypothetical protein
MIQLTFQPALDPFHAVFRLFRLRSIIEQYGPLQRDHVRILDFYLLFPFRIDGIRLTPSHRKYRSLAVEYESKKPYGDQPEDRLVFSRMEPIQMCALGTLAAHGFFLLDRWELGEVATSAFSIPAPLMPRVAESNAGDSDLMTFLAVLASQYELLGVNGLKDRTKLLEYRYDAV